MNNFFKSLFTGVFLLGVSAMSSLATDVDAASVTTSLTGIADSAQTLVNTIVPVALALVAVGILIKYLRKGAK
jgi:mannose/fructose/N-acetylgalactosamine-specific phosphotransferase system component IID